MPAMLEAQSSLTERYQTIVPEQVWRRFKLRKRDKIVYTIRPDGEVVLSRALPAEKQNPVLGQFLVFLARDMARNPQHLQSLDAGLRNGIRDLIDSVEVDLDAHLSAQDE